MTSRDDPDRMGIRRKRKPSRKPGHGGTVVAFRRQEAEARVTLIPMVAAAIRNERAERPASCRCPAPG